MTREEKLTRIAHANKILATFAGRNVELSFNAQWRICVSWDGYGNRRRTKCWVQMRGNNFYPVWHNTASWGGTQSTAMSQLIRWVQGKPVLAIPTWKYWSGELVALCNEKTLVALKEAGWPETYTCVLCKQTITGGLDWWNLDGVSGPCCSGRSGCKQTGELENKLNGDSTSSLPNMSQCSN